MQAKADILRQIHAIEPFQRFHYENAEVEIFPTLFYEGGNLIRCRETAWRNPDDCLWYVKLPEREIVALDGSVATIHHLNFHAPLRLTRENLPAYLQFRLFFGKEGDHRRHLVEGENIGIEIDGADFICTCRFSENRQLYAGRFRISPRGETELLEKTLQPQ